MEHRVAVRETQSVTDNTRRVIVDRPPGYGFTAGQSAEVSVDKPEWREEKRPFSFTSLTSEDCLEFMIRIYPAHHGVTEQIQRLKPGDHLILSDPFGSLMYHGTGYFVAGGTGITPFLAIFRNLIRTSPLDENTLIFSNRKESEIIAREELDAMFGDRVHYNITHEPSVRFNQGLVTQTYLDGLVTRRTSYCYVCGPDRMVKDVTAILGRLGVPDHKIITETE